MIFTTRETLVAATVLFILHFSMATASVHDTAADHNSFAIDLYQALAPEEGNLFFSPLSISTAMAMAYGGAHGQTAAEMAEVLHFPDSNTDLHQSNSELIHLLEKDNLHMANSLWPSLDVTLLESYTRDLWQHYGAKSQPLDYSGNPDQAVEIINSWIKEETAGKISNLLKPDDITPFTHLVLANAMVFSDEWENAFNPRLSKVGKFFQSDGQSTETTFMAIKNTKFMVAEMDEFFVLELPFKNKTTSLIMAIPKEIDGLAGLEKKISETEVSIWLKKMAPKELTLMIPRIKMEERLELSVVLKKMGIRQAFSLDADFSGMNGVKDLFIDRIFHQASLNLDEEGVEAAAATSVIFSRFGIPEFLKVDKPFMFMIRHRESGSILFMGRMVQPES